MISIWWIRRDLRLTDNHALQAALSEADVVIPLYILDPVFRHSSYTGEKRWTFMEHGLRSLDADLRTRGSRLIVREGKPLDVLRTVIEETGAAAVFAEEDYSPYSRQRDEQVRTELPLTLVPGLAMREPGIVLKEDGDPYIVFTPFQNTWLTFPPFAKADLWFPPGTISTPELAGKTQPYATRHPELPLFPAGEEHAIERLQSFVMTEDAPVYNYGVRRDLMAEDGTSVISPYLRWGMVSARRAAAAAYYAIDHAPNPDARKSAHKWLSELIWRDFYINILAHYPHVRSSSFRPQYDNINWVNDADQFKAWCEGRTGYPVVDAGMRQLLETGWMHNRTRMITASFLVKDLLIDWRWGEQFFMQHLVDGDPASNNGGWQWTAGTGTDAAPYFRIFNPVSQGDRYDPEGEYVRRWVPELASLPSSYIQKPWEMPEGVQAEYGVRIGQDYPAPIIDHKEARQRTLEAYKAARD